MDTQVGIVGAGPAGLLLAHLLHRAGHRVGRARGAQPRLRRGARARRRARAGRRSTCSTRPASAERLHREGLVHHGLELRFDGRGHRIDFAELTGGRAITVYGQQEVVKDLIAARLQAGGDAALRGRRRRRCTTSRRDGPSHPLPPRGRRARAALRRRRRLRRLPRRQPPDRSPTACCASTSASTRSPGSGSWPRWRPPARSSSTATTTAASRCTACARRQLTRLYLQCAPDDDIEEWPDERIWEELRTRLATDGGWRARRGPDRREGHHADAQLRRRADALRPALPRRRRGPHRPAHRRQGAQPRGRRRARPQRGARRLVRATATTRGLDAYSDTCLRRVWRVQHFSWWMTSMLHRFARRRPVRAAAAALAAALRRAPRARRPPRWPRTTSGSSVSEGGGLFGEVLARGRVRDGVRPTGRGCRRCSTSRPRWRARRRRPGSSRPSTPRRSRRRAGPSATTSTRSAPRPPRWATRRRRSCARCAPRSATRRPPTCTAAPRARTSSTARRCSSRGARSSRCSTTSRGAAEAAARLAERAPRHGHGRAHAAAAGRARSPSG